METLLFFQKKRIEKQMKTLLTIGIALYKSKGIYQLFLIFITATSLAPLLDSLKKFLNPNIDYIAFWIILMILDVASGVYKHSGKWAKNQPNTINKDDFFYKLLRKIFASTIWLVLVNAIEKIAMVESSYLETFGIGVLISWLSWSIASNLYVITGSSFPPKWIMSKLKKANENEKL